MKNGRFSDAKIMGILRQAESGVPVTELCREHGMSPSQHLLRNCLPGSECQLLQMACQIWRDALFHKTRRERYNRTVRHEWLDQNIFETIQEAQEQATRWLWTYNNDRPNMAIGGITPAMKLKQAA